MKINAHVLECKMAFTESSFHKGLCTCWTKSCLLLFSRPHWKCVHKWTRNRQRKKCIQRERELRNGENKDSKRGKNVRDGQRRRKELTEKNINYFKKGTDNNKWCLLNTLRDFSLSVMPTEHAFAVQRIH